VLRRRRRQCTIVFFCGSGVAKKNAITIAIGLGECCREEEGDSSYHPLLLWLVLQRRRRQ